MHFVKKNLKQKRDDFNKKLLDKKILKLPGAYNPLTAKLIEEIGYDGVYVSGGVMSNDLGYPELNRINPSDVFRDSFNKIGIKSLLINPFFKLSW